MLLHQQERIGRQAEGQFQHRRRLVRMVRGQDEGRGFRFLLQREIDDLAATIVRNFAQGNSVEDAPMPPGAQQVSRHRWHCVPDMSFVVAAPTAVQHAQDLINDIVQRRMQAGLPVHLAQ